MTTYPVDHYTWCTMNMNSRLFYTIRLRGHLDARWSDWFDGMTIAHAGDPDETILSGYLPDQAALHGILIKIRDLNLPLIAVQQAAPDGDEHLL